MSLRCRYCPLRRFVAALASLPLRRFVAALASPPLRRNSAAVPGAGLELGYAFTIQVCFPARAALFRHVFDEQCRARVIGQEPDSTDHHTVPDSQYRSDTIKSRITMQKVPDEIVRPRQPVFWTIILNLARFRVLRPYAPVRPLNLPRRALFQ